MSKAFIIAPGRYDIPGIGKVDSTKEVSNEKAFSIYKLSRRVFPWIKPGPDAAAFLKKQKLNAKEIASLIQKAKTTEEIEMLAGLSTAKAVNSIAETRLKVLNPNE